MKHAFGNIKRTDLERGSDAVEAVAKLRAAGSITEIMKALKGTAFASLNRSTLFRWLNNDPRQLRHRDTIERIKMIAAIFQQPPIRFAFIKNATEILPVHLLPVLTEKMKPTKIELHEKKSIDSCFIALKNDEVDVVVAPRQSSSADGPIRKICKLVEIPIGGIFPGRFDNDERKVLPFSNSNDLGISMSKGSNLCFGVLPNADYETRLQSFFGNYSVIPSIKTVLNYAAAFRKLKNGEIQGVIGHSVFIENCFAAIQAAIPASRGAVRERLEKLQRAPTGMFGPVKMEIYVNIDAITLKPGVARKVLEAFHGVITHIKKNENEDEFAQKVTELLGLESAPAKSGKDIIREYQYKMMTFDTDTLLKLWR